MPDTDASSQHRSPLGNPLSAVLGLGSRHLRAGLAVGLAGALLVHAAGAGHGYAVTDLLRLRQFAAAVGASARAQAQMTYEIEQEKLPDPPPEEPEPAPEPEAPPEPLPKAPPKAEPPAEPNPPPPAAAEAGKLLTADPDPNAPLDLTGDIGFVTGNGERYAGGITASTGKSQVAVRDRGAQADGVGNARTHIPSRPISVPTADLSRPANVVGNTAWNCPFPAEADLEQINHQRVELSVVVNPDGRAKEITVLRNGGSGFGAEAKACARRKRYAPALDRAGKPIVSTLRVNVNFDR